MARVRPVGYIESLSGKVCMHSDTSFRRYNGKTFTQKICYPNEKAPSAGQLQMREKFARVTAATKAALSNPETRAEYVLTWNKRKYFTLRDYVFHEKWKADTGA